MPHQSVFALPVCLALAAPLAAQDLPRQASPEILAAFDTTAGVLQELALPDGLPGEFDGPFEVDLHVDGVPRTLFLVPHSLRADDFQLLVQAPDGVISAVEPAPPATVRGFLVGVPQSLFAGSVSGGQIEGILRTSRDDPFQSLQPVSSVDPTASTALHILHDSADAMPLPYECGVTESAPERDTATSTGAGEGGVGSKIAEISCDADFEYFQKNGWSVNNTQNDIENVLNGVDSIYNSDFNIRYEIGTILVRTGEPDPYPQSDSGALLASFKDEWSTNQTGIHRDVAHLFTGKNIDGWTIGVAYPGGMCSPLNGYGLSESKFSGNYNSRVALTSHEIGHNWAADHCDGTSQCKIMCSGLGGCGSITSFGPAASAQIELKLASVSCVTGPPATSPPILFGATPTTSSAVSPGTVEITGTQLEWVDKITIGSSEFTAPDGFFIVDHEYMIATPDHASAAGTLSLTATNSIGTSNSLAVTYTESHPPVLVNEFWAFTGATYTWTMGGEVADLWFLAVSVGDNTTVPLFGYPLLINGQLIGSGVLDAAGVAKVDVVLAPSAVGLTFFSQVATIDGGSGAFYGASPVKDAFVLL